MNARPITWPTVPEGKARIRVVVNANRTRAEVERFVRTVVEWARTMQVQVQEEGKGQGCVVDEKSKL